MNSQQQQQQQHHFIYNKKKISSNNTCDNANGFSSLNHARTESVSSYYDTDSVFVDSGNNGQSSGGAKKVNVEVIMKSNPFRIEENEKTTRMELVRNDSYVGGNSSNAALLKFTYYVKPECEAKKLKGKLAKNF